MSGLITKNTLVKRTEDNIEKTLKPGVRESYMKIIVAGMKYAMSKGPEGLLGSLKDSQDPVTDIVKGAVGIVGLLRRAAKGTMPVDALIPATMVLILHGLDLAEQMGLLKVTAAEIDQATQLFAETIMPLLGISKEKFASMTEEVHGVMNDPNQMSKLQMPKQGVQ